MARHCTNCRYANPEWAQYCAHCGATLTVGGLPHGPVAVERDQRDGFQPAIPPPPAARPASCCRQRRRAWLAVVCLMAMGWFWVIKPRSRSHQHIFDPGPSASVHVAPSGDLSTEFSYHGDKDVADALYDLLRPDHVPIRVGRSGDGIIVSGTQDQIASIQALLNALRDYPNTGQYDLQLRTYVLPGSQVSALEDLLETARHRIHLEQSRGTLRVRAPAAIHDAIERLMPYLSVNTMTDISHRRSH